MKKYSLIRTFTIYSMITFIMTGLVLSYVISEHVKADDFENLTDATNFMANTLVVTNLSESDFNGVIPDSQKVSIVNVIKKSMINYKPQSVILINNKKTIILNSASSSNPSPNIDYSSVDKILLSDLSNKISKTYYAKDSNYATREILVFDIYVPIRYQERIIGIVVLRIPDSTISSHVNMTVQSIVLTLTGGLLVLFLLLVNILIKTSKTLIKQNNDLIQQKNELEISFKKLDNSYKNTVFALSHAVDARDPYTAGHSERVTKISQLLGDMLRLPEEQLRSLEYAALFHDIGKMGVPDRILLKKGKLTDEEFDIIKKHPGIGVDILESIDFLTESLPIILHHHENIVGNGYPDHLKGKDIPLGSRIIAIADSYDAMTTDRPYRKALSHQDAVDEILRNKGIQFDVKVVDVFMQIEQNIKHEKY